MEKEPIALEAAQASITTATVTIKTLRVNSRQLTQSTFRQLPTQQLVDEATTPSLLGIVWGWVNYKPPGDAENTTQFVVQFGERLCRCPFHLRSLPSGIWTEALVNMKESYYEQALSAILVHVVRDPSCLEHYRSQGRFAFTVRARGPFKGTSLTEVDARCLGIDDLWQHIVMASFSRPEDYVPRDNCTQDERESLERQNRERQERWVQHRETAVVKIRERLESWDLNLSASMEWWQSELDREANEAADYVARWNALMETLRAAEQLYIAT